MRKAKQIFVALRNVRPGFSAKEYSQATGRSDRNVSRQVPRAAAWFVEQLDRDWRIAVRRLHEAMLAASAGRLNGDLHPHLVTLALLMLASPHKTFIEIITADEERMDRPRY